MPQSSWFGDGGISSFDAATASLVEDKTKLTVETFSVDVGAVTRLSWYPVTGGQPFKGRARIRVHWDDVITAQLDGHDLTVQMYISPYDVGPDQHPFIIMYGAGLAGMVYRSNTWVIRDGHSPSLNGTKDVTFDITGPSTGAFTPNTKYWVALVPVKGALSDSVYDVGPWWSDSTDEYNVYKSPNSPFSLGRSVSFWTNRTPAAPVINQPSSNQIISSSSSTPFSFTPNDPDRIVGGATSNYTDVSGVQIQYSPQPTPENPSPAWTDIQWADSGGTLRKGWWIWGATANVANEGLQNVVNSLAGQIRCGGSVVAGEGYLPAGSWRIRMRTFDFGHPYPTLINSLGNNAGTYTADTFPSQDTSPWSVPVNVTILAQVPPPVPLSPVGHAAVVEGTPVVLRWLYKNTAAQSYPQSHRTIRVRKIGDPSWTTLVSSQASASAEYTVSGFAFVSGNEYEWQVQVRDSSGVWSDWSAVARFWVVPAPGSGGVRPLPASTIEGATLGCGTHRVFVYRRGGEARVGELRNLSYVDWSRVRDDISTSRVVVSDWDVDCGNLLSQLQPWAYELVVIRDNGYSKERVWEGPITLLKYERDKVTIDAKDMMGYAYRRIIKQRMSDMATGDSVLSRAVRVLQNVFAPDDPNILPHLTPLTGPNPIANQRRYTPEYGRTAFEEVDDMAANAGLDYTVVGRSILLWGTKNSVGELPEFRDKDLGAPPIVSVYGMSTANRYAVSDGNGIWGEALAGDLKDLGYDETYGLVEILSSTWASDSEGDSGSYTQEGAAKMRESFADFAEHAIGDRFPPPVVVRVPANTTLNPDTVISIQHLVPGVRIPLRSTGTLKEIKSYQKLDSVKVIEEAGKETISITMSPFNGDDQQPEEVE